MALSKAASMADPAAPSTLSTLSTLNKQSNKHEARRALRRFQQTGHASLDPDNDTHVTAYLTLRATMTHVPPGKLKKYLETASTSVTMGAQYLEDYWVVPKRNFPNGMPDAIKEYLVDPET